MKGLLGRIRSKKGSVLFLVIVVMSMLIIAASATFYVVNNQRRSVNVHYSSEQSYQWASSVGGTVSKYIDGYAKKLRGSNISGIAGHEDNILTKMLDLEVNHSFDAKLDLIDSGLDNDVTVTITKTGVSDDNMEHIFAITTTSQVNGETVTVTEYKKLTTSDYVPVAEPFTRFLTSTGYRSENCILRASEILSDAFFENEFTLLTNPTHIKSSILVRGSFTDTGLQCPDNGVDIPGLEIVVSQSFYVESTAGTGSTNVDKIYVGCDFTTTKAVSANEVYVLGNFTPKQTLMGSGKQLYYVNGDCDLQTTTIGCTIYVNGDLYLNASQNQGTIYVDGDVIINKDPNVVQGWVQLDKVIYTGSIKYDDGSEVEPDRLATLKAKKGTYDNPLTEAKIKEIEDHIYEKTGKQNYAQWNAEKYFNTKLNASNNLPTIQPGADGSKVCTITGNCILKESEAWAGDWNEHVILIDTTKATSDIFIKLQPLEGSDTFSFMKPVDGSWISLDIIVKGPRAVVFILPENINMVKDIGFIGHADLVYAMANETEKTDIDNRPGATNADKLVSYLTGTNQYTYIHDKMFSNARLATFNSLIKAEENENGTYYTFDKSKFAANSTIHNNIFLVTSGKENTIE
ncbi:MAG: hypothetical protein K2J79_05860, partial [Ruminiclostridium sp.]|nr:hypothetical protein [Ruminiclostridium sp.]